MIERSNANRSVFVAGATGAIGRQLLPMLIGEGYQVFGTTRNRRKTAHMEAIGVRPVARRLESQGPAGTRVETAAPDLAFRVPDGSRVGS